MRLEKSPRLHAVAALAIRFRRRVTQPARKIDEALSNVMRHSGADHVDLVLRREAERVSLVIADNGRGVPDNPAPGMGLGNMRERAQALPAGSFEFDTAPGRGTRITVSFLAETPSA